jgi:Zn-dependent M28 family amino/carboxypeptidase
MRARESCRVLLAMSCIAGAALAAAPDTTAPGAAAVPAAVQKVADAYITRAALEAPIRFLASDLLEGRGPGTRGDQLARLYLQSELEGMGYKAAFAGNAWQQPFDIVGITGQFPKSWSFKGKEPVELAWREDYIAASGVQNETVAVNDAELVFVGYGIQAPEFRWDDFKSVNLTGKVLVMMNNDPDWDPQLFAGKRRLYYGRWDYKYASAARQGAAGAIIIHTTPSAGYPWQVVQSSWGGEQFQLPAAAGEARLRVKAWATESAVRRLLKAGGQDLDKLLAAARSRDFKPVPLGLHTSISFTNKLARVQTANVGGVLQGSDAKLAAQVVLLSAHHDHFGIGEPDASGDRIYHGAVDNASGCAQVLAMARGLAQLRERPRRSVLALFVAGEERGLLGSAYYAEHPSVPAGRIAANINVDGGSIFGRTRDITLVSMGKSSLDAIATAIAKSQGRALTPDQFPDRGYYYRSDQFSFAKIGVPALYFSEGTDVIGKPAGWGKEQHEQWELKKYHQPGDKLEDSWNFEGMIQDAQLYMLSAWVIAQAPEMPAWKPGDEFAAARARALQALPGAH